MYNRKYKEGKATPTTPATAKQEPKKKPSLLSHPIKHMQNPKAVPLGGRGTALAVEGGNSLSILDCPQPTHLPQHTTQINRTKRARAYNPASELPLSEP